MNAVKTNKWKLMEVLIIGCTDLHPSKHLLSL